MKTFFNSIVLTLLCSVFTPIICQDVDMDGWTIQQGDCNDNNPRIYPGAPELCNSEDDNCNGKIDELEVSCAPSISVKLSDNGEASITIEEITKNSTSNCPYKTSTLSRVKFFCDDIPSRIVFATFKDTNNNIDTCQVQVIINDKITPSIECKTEYDLELNIFGTAKITKASDLLAKILDNCGVINSGIVASRTQFFCDDIPFKNVQVNVTDVIGNKINCTTKVNIIDKLGPTIKCKDKVELVAEPNATSFKLLNNTNFNYVESLTDNCGIIKNTTVLPQEVKLKNILPTKVSLTVTAIDINGNESSCTTQVTIRKSPTDKKNDKDDRGTIGN